MFTQLLASRPARQQAAPEIAGSIAMHGFIVAAAMASFAPTPKVFARPEQHSVVYQPPTVELPKPTQTVPPAPRAPDQPQQPSPTIPNMIDQILPGLPTISTAPPTIDFGGGTPRVPTGLTGTAPVEPAPGTAYIADQVEVTAAMAKGSPVPRYPATLRFAAVDGTARFQFVVDTLGRVELGTVRELESTRVEFALAVRNALPNMRFTPARVGGRPVRQLVEFPTVFRIQR